jgi:glycosyltransferase involved in cell wall biosynthesis
MNPPRVLVVSYHFYPSPEVGAKRPSETAIYLQRHGYDVTVLRAVDPHAPFAESEERLTGLRIASIAIPRKLITALWIKTKSALWRASTAEPKSGARQKDAEPTERPAGFTLRAWVRRQLLAFDTLIGGHKLWMFKAFTRLLQMRLRERFDIVIASGPPFVGYLCGAFAARLFRARLILDFRDPWHLHTDAERVSYARGHPLAQLEDYLGHVCVAASHRIIVASPGIERHLTKTFAISGKPIDLVRNGFDPDALLEQSAPCGGLSLLYAGSLYANRDPFPLLEALRAVISQPHVEREKVSFKLVGRCEESGGIELRPWLRERDLDDVVEVLPLVDKTELRRMMAESNVLVNLAQGQPSQIPAKSYEYLASGRHVLTLAEFDSDVARLFAEAKTGVVVEPGNFDALVEALGGFYRRLVCEGRSVSVDPDVLSMFRRSTQLEKFTEIVNHVCAPASVL